MCKEADYGVFSTFHEQFYQYNYVILTNNMTCDGFEVSRMEDILQQSLFMLNC